MPLAEAPNYLKDQEDRKPNGSKSGLTSFKQLKAQAQQRKYEEPEDVVMNQVDYALSALMLDRVYQALIDSCVILEDFTQFPIIR